MSTDITGDTARPEAPPHLENYAPVQHEVTVFDLDVDGQIPLELNGRYLRNGPNPKTGNSPHWFFGDGMIHGVELRDGRALSYRNRWVRTRRLEEGWDLLGPDGTIDMANTHVICHSGRILALMETSYPTELTAELDTVGRYDYDGKLTTNMTAHPKLCPLTGEMHFFGYGFAPPFLTYHRVDPAGRLVHTEVINTPGPTMIHDFALTENHVIFMDLPLVFEPTLLAQGTMPYRWSDDYGARLGVMPRAGRASDILWHDIDPCMVFHVVNAFEAEGRLLIDVVRYPELWRESTDEFGSAALHRWIIDPSEGKVREEPLDDRPIEFPRTDDRLVGRPYRYSYTVKTGTSDETGPLVSKPLFKHDLRTGTVEVHDFGAGKFPGEAVFVPTAATAAEDAGYLMTYVYDAARGRSDFVILDATDFNGPPVATVAIPERIPFGFHGSWVPEGA